MKFMNFAKYGQLDVVARVRPAHFAYADDLRAKGKLAIGGPLLDDEGRRVGLIFVYETASQEEARALARQDPFVLEGAIASFELHQWIIEGVNPALLTPDFSSERQKLAAATTDDQSKANWRNAHGNA